jgi:hypothetical protein
MNIDDVTFTPIWENHNVQVVKGNYGEYEFIERTYYPRGFLNLNDPTYFYSFWVGNKPVEFKNSMTGEDPYEKNSYFIIFKTLEEMVEFLDQWEI